MHIAGITESMHFASMTGSMQLAGITRRHGRANMNSIYSIFYLKRTKKACSYFGLYKASMEDKMT